MSPTRRHVPLLLVVLGLLALFLPMLLQRADAADLPPAPAVAVALAGPDYATDTFGDPWDMSNAADINLDPAGPTLYVTNQSLSGGAAHFSTSRVSYVSLLWPGLPAALPWGRDGRLARNRIATASYSRMHAHLYASRAISMRLRWTQACSGCTGYVPFTLAAGWNDVDVALTGPKAVGNPWSGSVQGLRFDYLTSHATDLAVDFVRIYRPSAAGVVRWSAPGAAAATLRWSDSSTFLGTDGVHGGPVTGARSASSGDVVSTDLSGWAPGTRLFAYDGSTAVQVAEVAIAPLPTIDAPTAAGCGGTTWRFTSSRSTAGVGNATRVSYGSTGVLTATNGAPHPNDPYVLMPLSSTGFDGRVNHRVTVVESYDGAFSLASAPGGGTMGRILWREPGHSAYSQTPPLVTPTGKQTIVLDMAQPTSVITEPEGTAAMRYAFASTARVTALRWDPNEDPGARRWHLYSVRVAPDCRTRTAFSVTWHDRAYTPGSTATVLARSPGGRVRTIAANVPETSGTNSVRAFGASLGTSSWTILVRVTTPSGATTTTQDGPLVIV